MEQPSAALGNMRSLLSVGSWTPQQLLEFCHSAQQMETHPPAPFEKLPIALLFAEPSTRTRISFEIAAGRLGLTPILISKEGSALQKGESLLDTLQTLEALGVRAVVLRHATSGILEALAHQTSIPLLNAGDGLHEHPTQALLDLYTLLQWRPSIEGLRLLFIGDILYSRVFRSLQLVLRKLGARVAVCAPPPLLPTGLPEAIEVFHHLQEAVKGQEALYVLRMQGERHGELPPFPRRDYVRFYQLRQDHLPSPSVRILNPGPVQWGFEMDTALKDHPQSLIQAQVQAGLPVRMAALYRAITGSLWRGA